MRASDLARKATQVWVSVRRLSTDHPWLVDGAIAVAVTVVTVVFSNEFRPTGWPLLGPTGYTLCALTSLPTVARRRAPMTVLLTCCLASVLYTAVGYFPAVNFYGSELALYTVATIRPPRRVVPGAVAMVAMEVYSGGATHEFSLWSLAVQSTVIAGLLWKFGDNTRQLGERNRELAAVALRLKHEQAERARRAVTEERMRIARELHDVVSHHMSVVSVQAGLAQYVLESEPATAHQALDTVLTSTADALEEMRRLLHLLRLPSEPSNHDDPENWSRQTGQPYDPAPGLWRLGELLDRVRAAGVPVDLVITGTARPLPSGVELCAYRVIQESLTNVLKHARHAHAHLALHYAPGEFRVRIGDDGSAAVTDQQATGNGLPGMRERAKLYGGTLVAGRREQGGYEVKLTLPLISTTSGDHRGGASVGGADDDRVGGR